MWPNRLQGVGMGRYNSLEGRSVIENVKALDAVWRVTSHANLVKTARDFRPIKPLATIVTDEGWNSHNLERRRGLAGANTHLTFGHFNLAMGTVHHYRLLSL